MSFRRRTYPEIMENVLTGLTGGVSAESHPFPPDNSGKNTLEHALENPPIASIISVYGVRNNLTYKFLPDSDYQLTNNKLIWLEKGNTPDAGSNFLVNYRSKDSTSPFNDLHVGSVLRTLAESFSLELAGLYAQAEAVYDAGFIDTASNRSLDNVVALLDINRIKAGRNSTKVKFSRSANSVGDIHIPAGTRVSNVDASIQFETIETVNLLDGQNSVQVDGRDIEDNIEAMVAESLVILTKPLVGIDSVTNPQATTVLERDETDNELRTRAKNFLHGSEKATIGAIEEAIAQQNILAEVTENDPAPGFITVSVHTDSLTPEIETRLKAAIRDVRPAGIKVEVVPTTPPLSIDMNLLISTVNDLLNPELRAIQEQAVEGISDYINSTKIGETISMNRIIGLTLSDDRVTDVRILSAVVGAENVLDRDQGILNMSAVPGVTPDSKVAVTSGTVTLVDPALATMLSGTIQFPISSAAPSESAIKTALEKTITIINDLNGSELPSNPSAEMNRQRQLNYGKLLAVIPLPIKPPIQDYNDVAGLTDQELPTSTDAGEYQVQFLVTSESGLSHILESEASPAITLTPFERLTLSNIEIKAKAGEVS